MQYKIADIVYANRTYGTEDLPPLIIVGVPPKGKQYPYVVRFLADMEETLDFHEWELTLSEGAE
jgi:hypothetical protein